MTRSQKQKKLAAAARTLATKIRAGKTVAQSGYNVVTAGKPTNVVGQILSQAGVTFGKNETETSEVGALAKALNTTTDILPSTVQELARNLYNTARVGTRSQVLANLEAFATAISTAKVRKTYTKSGLYTAAARDAGTFGKQAVAN